MGMPLTHVDAVLSLLCFAGFQPNDLQTGDQEATATLARNFFAARPA